MDPNTTTGDELAARLQHIADHEQQDPSRRALTARELAVYVGTAVALCLFGLVVMVL